MTNNVISDNIFFFLNCVWPITEVWSIADCSILFVFTICPKCGAITCSFDCKETCAGRNIMWGRMQSQRLSYYHSRAASLLLYHYRISDSLPFSPQMWYEHMHCTPRSHRALSKHVTNLYPLLQNTRVTFLPLSVNCKNLVLVSVCVWSRSGSADVEWWNTQNHPGTLCACPYVVGFVVVRRHHALGRDLSLLHEYLDCFGGWVCVVCCVDGWGHVSVIPGSQSDQLVPPAPSPLPPSIYSVCSEQSCCLVCVMSKRSLCKSQVALPSNTPA